MRRELLTNARFLTRRSRTAAMGVAISALASTMAFAEQLTFVNNLGYLASPNAAAVGPDGTVYITSPGDNAVNLYSSTGVPQGAFGGSTFGFQAIAIPYGLAVSPANQVYISDAGTANFAGHPQIEVYQHLHQVAAFGTSGTGTGQFEFPAGMAINPTIGYVYIADFDENRIQVFDQAGNYYFQFGQGYLNTPVGIALDSAGNVYVADGNNNKIDIFDGAGEYISSFGSLGSAPGQLHTPTGVAVSSTGMIYVADANNNRIDIFNSSNAFVGSMSTAGARSLSIPYGIAVAPSGMVYVAEQVGDTADRFFDPASWVSGTNVFTDSTLGPTSLNVGAGQILGASLTLDSARGLVVGNTLTVDSDGTFNLSGGTISTSTLEVAGTFVEHSGSLTVATVQVDAGGLFQDNQVQALSVSSQVVDNGELDLDDNVTLTTPLVYVQPGGTLATGAATVSTSALYVANGGEVQLANPISSRLQVPTIINDGLIDGSGRISGTVTNNSDGEISVATAQTLVISGAGNTNAGLITLAGGTIHFIHDLVNQSGALIAGFGALRVDGGLTSDGTISLAGSAAIFSSVTNNSDGAIHLTGTQPSTFFGPVDNEGSLNVDPGANGTFYGTFTGGGPILDNGFLDFATDSSTGPINGTGIITIGSTSGPAVLTIAAIGAANNQSAVILTAGSKLDITGNTLTLNTTTPGHDAVSIRIELTTAYDHGAWDGNGITSSLAAANPGTTVGYLETGSQIKIKYTWLGDTNLDGIVSSADLSAISSTGTTWATGDFNYDGVVNADDYALFMLGAAASGGANISTALPEPGFALLVSFAALALARHHKSVPHFSSQS